MTKPADHRPSVPLPPDADPGISPSPTLSRGLGALVADMRHRQISTDATAQRPLLPMPQVPVGREAQIQVLQAALERVLERGAEVLALTGPSGIGKTFLVETLRDRVCHPLGAPALLWGQGKYDPFQNPPFGALGTAIRSAVRQALARPEPEVPPLVADLGPHAAVVRPLVPEIGALFPDPPEAPPCPPTEAQQRTRLALRRLVRSLASSHPLVLFLDDFQWADPSALAVVEDLAGNRDLTGVLVICAIRQAEPSRPEWLDVLGARGVRCTWLDLGGLDREDTLRLLRAVLGDFPDAAPLVQAALDRTHGNPFVTLQYLRGLHDAGLLGFDDTRGTWSFAPSANEVGPSPDAHLHAFLSSLDPERHQVLAAAACLGSTVELPRLAAAGGWDVEALRVLLGERTLLPYIALLPGPPVTLRFFHDRVREAVYDTIPDPASLHGRLARGLLACAHVEASSSASGGNPVGVSPRRDTTGAPVAEPACLFAAMDQLARAEINALPPEDILDACLAAARLAQTRAACHDAVRYLSVGVRVMDDQPGIDPTRERRVLLEMATNHRLCGAFDAAEACLAAAMTRCREVLDAVAVHQARLELFPQQGRYQDAVEEGRTGLLALGISTPPLEDAAGWLSMAPDLAPLLAGRDLQGLVDHPLCEDPRKVAEFSFLATLMPPTFLWPHMLVWLSRRMVQMCLVEGHFREAPIAYATLALMASYQGQADEALALGRLAMDLVERPLHAPFRAQVSHLFLNWVAHWHEPLDRLLPQVPAALHSALGLGLVEYAGWLAMNAAATSFSRGGPLPETLQHQLILLDLCRTDIPYADAEHFVEALVGITAGLLGRREILADQESRGRTVQENLAALSHYQVSQAYIRVGLLWVATLRDEPFSARQALIREIQEHSVAIAGLRGAADLQTLEALAWCDELRTCSDARRPALWTGLESAAAALGIRARRCPANDEAAWRLVLAEMADLHADPHADGAYLVAFETAEGWGQLHLSALSLGRLQRRHLRLGHSAMGRILESAERAAMARWLGIPAAEGAPGEVDADRLLDAVRGILRTPPGPQEDHLIETLVAHAGARRGALFLDLGGLLTLAARCGADPSDNWPVGLVRFTHRTREPLVLPPSSSDALYVMDPWVGKHPGRAILCLPLEHQRRALGVVYLEGWVGGDAFSPRRVDLLRVLATLAASTLLTTRLFRDLEQTTAQLRRSNEGLEQVVTARTRELSDLARSYRSTMDALGEGVLRLDATGRVLLANPEAERLFGVPRDQLLGRALSDLPPVTGASGRALSAEAMEGATLPVDGILHRFDGTAPPVAGSLSPVLRADGTREGLVLALRDLTTHRRLEEQLLHAQKMDAIGRFAGGMAHDLNNLLTPVLGHVALLERLLSPTDDTFAEVRAIRHAAEQAAHLTRQALAFGRRAEVYQRPLDLSAVVRDVAGFLRRSVDRAIRISVEGAAVPHWILGDAAQMEQVLLNLCLNAVEAVNAARTQRGRDDWCVTIGVADAEAGDVPIRRPEGASGPQVALWVTDTGIGMDEATRTRAFEPFFTTRPRDRVAGLGLSIVHTIFTQHQGVVVLASQPGTGTTLCGFLPACAPEESQPLPAPTLAPEGQGEVILVVDDEETVRSVTNRVLTLHGYDVKEARDGGSAVQQLGVAHVDLVLLDVSMPGMPAVDLLRLIRRDHPGLPVVLWSGYSSRSEGTAELIGQADGFVEKPFAISDLVRAVSTALEHRGGKGRRAG